MLELRNQHDCKALKSKHAKKETHACYLSLHFFVQYTWLLNAAICFYLYGDLSLHNCGSLNAFGTHNIIEMILLGGMALLNRVWSW